MAKSSSGSGPPWPGASGEYESSNALIEAVELCGHVPDKHQDPRAYVDITFRHDLLQSALKHMAALAEPHAALYQERARLVDQPCAAVDQALAGPVQSLKVELLGRLYADKAHCWPGRGFGDGLCIPVVVL